jgi:hypothetical protein
MCSWLQVSRRLRRETSADALIAAAENRPADRVALPMAEATTSAIMGSTKGGIMHVLPLSLMIALAACLLLLLAFGLYTHHVDH